MTDCLFCKIAAKEIPSDMVYEDDNVFAFMDITPVNPGHVLIVPKKHSEGLHDADAESLQQLVLVTQRLAKAITATVNAPAFNVMQNNGSEAGQVIKHLHVHLIPRHADDGFGPWHQWHGKKPYEAGESADLAQKIRAQLEV